MIDDRIDMAEAIALGDHDMARQDDDHAGTDLAGFDDQLTVS